MVGKRDLSSNFTSEAPKQTIRRSQGQYGRTEVVSMNSLRNHSVSGSTSGSINPHSEAIALNVQRKREQYCRSKATESLIVIAVNIALSLAAIAAIARLLPYQSSQKDRLDEITTEVNSVEQRVNGMREQLPQTLNSGKSQELLLRKQGWIKNNQMTIKLLTPSEIASPDNDGMMPTTTTAQKVKNP